jgi:sugar lactone lactonase YvrE
MKHPSVLFISLLLLAIAFPTQAWIRSPATTFAVLPPGATTPEGITVDPQSGDVYVSTFGFPDGTPATAGQVVVFDAQGKLLRQLVLTPQGGLLSVSPHLLGLAFHPATHALLVLDFGNGNVIQVDPNTGAATPFSSIGGGLNALTFDSNGFVYVSDSFQGIIWRIPPAGGPATQWVQHPLLTTSGVPPFGANGLAFNNAGTTLLVANTGDDSVVQIPVSGSPLVAGTPTVLAYSINGADGLIVDASDNIWVCANQSDEIVVLDKTGKVIAKLGDFNGVDNQGAARGLLFPASLVFSGNFLLVTNLALDLATQFGVPTVDSQWAAKVKTFTVAKINRHLPPISPSTGSGQGQNGQGQDHQGRGH